MTGRLNSLHLTRCANLKMATNKAATRSLKVPVSGLLTSCGVAPRPFHNVSDDSGYDQLIEA